MGKTIIKIILPILFLSFLACGDDGCVESTVSYCVGEMINKSSAINPSKINVYGLGQKSDSALIEGLTTKSFMDLLLNPNDTITNFKVDFIIATDTITDTIRFYYENKDFFIDMDCGCTVHHFVDSVRSTNYFINTIEIINPEITNVKTNNFIINY